MKKALLLTIVFSMVFGLFSCSKSPIKDDSTTSSDISSIAETLTSIIVKTIDISGSDKGNDKELTANEASAIVGILENAEWSEGATADCLNDYSVEISGKKIYYHSECGTFNDNEGNRSFTVSENQRVYINSLLGIEESDSLTDTVAVLNGPAIMQTSVCFEPTAISSVTTQFGIELLKEAAVQEKNALVSPISALTALTMTANGAKGDTLKQIETVLGGKTDSLNEAVGRFIESTEKQSGISLANSVWFNKTAGLTVNKNFTRKVTDTFGAEIFNENFNGAALQKINRWVSKNTDGTINDMLKEIPKDAVAYLINTVLFDGEWKVPYDELQISENISFTASDGTVRKVTMLNSEENIDTFFSFGKVKGFRKEYTNGCSFVGILPDDGISVEEALDSFTANQFAEGIAFRTVEYSSPSPVLRVHLPKFELECSFKLSNALKKMGMPLAFNSKKADFSDMATCPSGNIYINEVFHNTYISLGEKGTKAGAATIVEMKAESAPVEEKIIDLNFNRPFIYAVCAPDGTPLFMGVVRELG